MFSGDGLIIDRLQTATVAPNVPKIPVYEIGNNNKLTTIRDIPELSFDVESFDVSCKFEAQLLGINPSSLTVGEEINFNSAVPLTVISPFRTSLTNFAIINGAVVPHLALKQVQYKFGVKQDASQTYTLAGDSVFYTPNVPYEDVFTGDGTTKTFTLSHTADEYYNTTAASAQYVLNVSVYNTDGTFYRLFNGTAFDYTDTPTNFTLAAATTAPLAGSTIRAQYSSSAADTIAQSVNTADGISVKPAAIRSKDMDIFIGTTAATPVWSRLTAVQSFDMTWSTNGFDSNEEFGNPLVVSTDYVTSDVNGTVTTRDNSVTDLFKKMYITSAVTTGQVIGALSSVAVPMEIHLNDPASGARIKTLFVPDARFDPPDINARVNQKIETPFKFTSDTGQMYVYNGDRPAGFGPAGPTAP